MKRVGIILLLNLCGVCLRPAPALAIDVEGFNGDRREIAGTPEREEFEYKTAFWISGAILPSELVKVLQKGLDSFQQKQSFAFAKLTGGSYFLDPSFQTFAFKDYYLDTGGEDVLKKISR